MSPKKPEKDMIQAVCNKTLKRVFSRTEFESPSLQEAGEMDYTPMPCVVDFEALFFLQCR